MQVAVHRTLIPPPACSIEGVRPLHLKSEGNRRCHRCAQLWRRLCQRTRGSARCVTFWQLRPFCARREWRRSVYFKHQKEGFSSSELGVLSTTANSNLGSVVTGTGCAVREEQNTILTKIRIQCLFTHVDNYDFLQEFSSLPVRLRTIQSEKGNGKRHSKVCTCEIRAWYPQ